MDARLGSSAAELDTARVACLVGCGEIGLGLYNESKRPGSQEITGERSDPYVRWIREYSGGCPKKRSR